jgi:hypothetical protein
MPRQQGPGRPSAQSKRFVANPWGTAYVWSVIPHSILDRHGIGKPLHSNQPQTVSIHACPVLMPSSLDHQARSSRLGGIPIMELSGAYAGVRSCLTRSGATRRCPRTVPVRILPVPSPALIRYAGASPGSPTNSWDQGPATTDVTYGGGFNGPSRVIMASPFWLSGVLGAVNLNPAMPTYTEAINGR